MELKVFGGWINDDTIRKESSSGGVFSAFAEEIINDGGIVYGSTLHFVEGKAVCRHESCETIKDIGKFRGSKYTESHVDGIYKNIRSHLNSGRKVLFSGTPCQIGGLLAFLNKNYDNLITLDCICHGIPSKKLLDKYLSELKEEHHNEINSFEFRNKDNGWQDYCIKIEYADGSVSMETARDTSYMKLFFSDMFIRESCFRCQYKGLERQSDLTIGDFWGVDRFFSLPGDEIKKGVSVILCNSKKGIELLTAVEDRLTIFQTEERIFETTNIYLKSNAVRPYDKHFFDDSIDARCLSDTLNQVEKGSKVRAVAVKFQKKLPRNWFYNISNNKLPSEKMCYSCTACSSICPKNAIEMVDGTNGFRYPRVDKQKCVNCGLCLKHCPRLRGT